MSDKKDLFLKILKVELEETVTDIAVLVKNYNERYKNREITHYVQQENEAFLEREIRCLEKLVFELEKFPLDDYPDRESFLEGLRVFLKNFVKVNQFPQAVFLLVDRKLQKVIKYIY